MTAQKYLKRGFTLVELLIVIAILGVLAVVVLVAINPVQQLARARDSGRSSAVAQLGHALESFAAVHNGTYPTITAVATDLCTGSGTAAINVINSGWVTNCLVNTSEIKVVPAAIAASQTTYGSCAADATHGAENGFCLVSGSNSAVIYTLAEAQVNQRLCVTGGTQMSAYFAYSTSAGRGGLWCGTAAASIPTAAGGNGAFAQ